MPDSMIYRVQNIKLNVKVHQPDLHSSSDIITPEHNRFLNFNSLTVCYLDYIFNTLTNQNFTLQTSLLILRILKRKSVSMKCRKQYFCFLLHEQALLLYLFLLFLL